MKKQYREVMKTNLESKRARRRKAKYQIFHRKWWKHNEDWPDAKEPSAGETKYKIGYAETEEQARKMCKEWNETHEEGKYSDRAEYTSIY